MFFLLILSSSIFSYEDPTKYKDIDPSLNLTLNKSQKREVNIAMSNTFGFGGHNACVVFKKI